MYSFTHQPHRHPREANGWSWSWFQALGNEGGSDSAFYVLLSALLFDLVFVVKGKKKRPSTYLPIYYFRLVVVGSV